MFVGRVFKILRESSRGEAAHSNKVKCPLLQLTLVFPLPSLTARYTIQAYSHQASEPPRMDLT
jgi:hypothetical protein